MNFSHISQSYRQIISLPICQALVMSKCFLFENLLKTKVIGPNLTMCLMCGVFVELTSHLFVICDLSNSVWY